MKLSLILLNFLCFLSTSCCPSDSVLKSKIVRVKNEGRMCTGEQVKAPSGESYILTAGHCKGIMAPDGTFTIQTEQGVEIKRKFIAEDPESDLLLIEGLPKMEGLTVGSFLANGQESIRTITHGGNLDLYETKGETVQSYKIPIPLTGISSDEEEKACASMPKNEVVDTGFFGKMCVLHVWEIITTVPLRPGSSGGPAFNSKGELVGVVSALVGYGFGTLVSLSDIHKFLKNY